jgi:uncharacterized cupredoxin-like copper-binding protein
VSRTRLILCTGVVALGSSAALPAAGFAAGGTHSTTTVTVTAGKPSELAFTLSKVANLKAGTVTFKVKNVGRATHDFKVCTSPVKSASKNTCNGKVTKMLKTGQSAVLTVKLTKKGMYEYLCSVPGHAAAGMKGLLGIGVPITTAPSATNTTPGKTTADGTQVSPTPPPAKQDVDNCPPGATISSQVLAGGGGGDHDYDDDGGPDDMDGCI